MAASKTAGEILEAVIEDGQKELERASAGLAFSGFAAGLNISFGMVALSVVAAITGETGFAAYAVYPIGFLIVILGRAQLFTENTVTPVTVVLTDGSRLPDMLRLWVVILAANLAGTVVFALAVAYGNVLPPPALENLLGYVEEKTAYGFWTVVLKAIFGGWLVALIAWLVAASRDTISQAFFIYVLAFLIPAAGLVHCVAGSSEVLVSVFQGATGWGQYLFGFLVPTTLGNVIGGLFLVTLLNYGQVIGSKEGALRERTGRNRRRDNGL